MRQIVIDCPPTVFANSYRSFHAQSFSMTRPLQPTSSALVSALFPLMLVMCALVGGLNAFAGPEPGARAECCLGHHSPEVAESRTAHTDEVEVHAASLRLTDWGASRTSRPCCLAACCRHGMPLAIPAIADAGSQSSRPDCDAAATSTAEAWPWSRVCRSCWPRQVDRLSDSGSSVALHLRLRVMII